MAGWYETYMSQVPSEIDGLVGILRDEGVTRFLEVGSRFGGSLWRIATSLARGSTIISCDSGSGMGGKQPGARASLEACIDALRRRGYDAHLVVGDSQLPQTIEKVRQWAPFDAVFIDADHELKGVIRDWHNYGALARIVAFHDVAWEKPEGYANSKMVEVPLLWRQLREQYRHQEFIDRSGGGNMGIGVLWR